MRKSIEVGILLISVILALSIFVAFAENQTAKDKVNATKINTTNGTINQTENNTNVSTSQPNKNTSNNNNTNNKTTNNTTNMTNPFAKAKGAKPGGL